MLRPPQPGGRRVQGRHPKHANGPLQGSKRTQPRLVCIDALVVNTNPGGRGSTHTTLTTAPELATSLPPPRCSCYVLPPPPAHVAELSAAAASSASTPPSQDSFTNHNNKRHTQQLREATPASQTGQRLHPRRSRLRPPPPLLLPPLPVGVPLSPPAVVSSSPAATASSLTTSPSSQVDPCTNHDNDKTTKNCKATPLHRGRGEYTSH